VKEELSDVGIDSAIATQRVRQTNTNVQWTTACRGSSLRSGAAIAWSRGDGPARGNRCRVSRWWRRRGSDRRTPSRQRTDTRLVEPTALTTASRAMPKQFVSRVTRRSSATRTLSDARDSSPATCDDRDGTAVSNIDGCADGAHLGAGRAATDYRWRMPSIDHVKLTLRKPFMQVLSASRSRCPNSERALELRELRTLRFICDGLLVRPSSRREAPADRRDPPSAR
jgi:hypothetical protein